MNSSAALKAFVGEHGGAVCTSTNARAVLEWALRSATGRRRAPAAGRCCSSPTSTSAATPATPSATPRPTCGCGTRASTLGGLTEADIKEAHLPAVEGPLLGAPALPARAHRGLPGRAPRRHRRRPPRVRPRRVRSSPTRSAPPTTSSGPSRPRPAGSVIAVGTEIHLVQRLDDETPDKTVVSLDPLICPCSTMFRIDAPHLAWVLESLVDGRVDQPITVDPDTTANGPRSPSTGCSPSPDTVSHPGGHRRPGAIGHDGRTMDLSGTDHPPHRRHRLVRLRVRRAGHSRRGPTPPFASTPATS